MNLVNKFNRFCGQVLSNVIGLDVCSCYDDDKRADWSSPEDVKHLMDYHPVIGWKLFEGPVTLCLRLTGVRPIKASAWRQRQGHKWISRLVRLLYFVFNFHLLVILYFQYSYDFDLVKLIVINHEYRAKKWNKVE